MKAMICTEYGTANVLKLAEVNKPVPKDNEVLVRVHATSVTAADCRIRGLNVPAGFGIIMRLVIGITKPRQPILGANYAGTVEAVGSQVSLFKPGDSVFGSSGMRFGAYAEFMCVPEASAILMLSEKMTYETGAAFPFGALTALVFLRDLGKIQKDQKILIYGASGAVGTAAVQLAKYYGADVTGVCSTANGDLVKSLGADSVIDYTLQDFTRNGVSYDIIFDTVGKTDFSRCLLSLKNNGRYLLAVAGLPMFLRALFVSLTTSKKVIPGIAGDSRDDLAFLKQLYDAGKIKSVIDRSYSFEQLPEAHRYAEAGHKKGNVVIKL